MSSAGVGLGVVVLIKSVYVDADWASAPVARARAAGMIVDNCILKFWTL